MNVIPVVFAFDNNLTFPACVCISSLMMHAKQDTFYDIFIIHSENEELDRTNLDKMSTFYPNCRIQYRTITDVFSDAFQIRGITTPTYYRLLIPELIPEYDKIIYADVDIIFRMDLSDVYATDLSKVYLAATYEIDMNISENGQKHIQSIAELTVGEYIQAGFLMMNCDLIRKDRLQERFLELTKQKFTFQDQDILNIACAGRIHILPWHYNMTTYSYYYMEKEPGKLERYANSSFDIARHQSNIHYNGAKPWKSYAINFDIWWEYYRKSPFFESKLYFDFFNTKLTEYDRLSLWKRIKILGRYFIHGRKKS